MKKLITAVALLLMAPAGVSAQAPTQDAQHPYRGQGYLFLGLGWGTAAPGYTPSFEHVGGGGEGFLYKGLGFGGEAEYAHWGPVDEQAWIGSADFSYHFGRHAPRRKLDPFVLGGVSVVGPTQAGGGRGSPAGNFGGGANWWLGEHAALRFEFRDVVGAAFWTFNHVPSFRIGVTFR